MNEEALKMYAELAQEVSLCQDEDIKALGKGILKLANNYDKSLKEIERLNNIIKELEKYLIEYSQDLEFRCYANTFLEKLQELKGDSSNE